MPSKIQVDQIAGATGSTVTLPSGQTLDLSSGTVTLPSAALSALNASNLTSGTVPSARLSLTSSDLPTVPTTKGGTGLTTIGTAAQVLRVNSGATGLEFGTVSGGIISSHYIEKTDTFTTTSVQPSFVDITTLTLTLTPASASSKFLIFARVSGLNWTHGHSYFRLVRDSTAIHVADAFGTATRASSIAGDPADWAIVDHVMIHRDAPNTTSSITYKVQGAAEYGTLYVNRSARDGGGSDGRTTSSLTVLELGV